MKRFFKIICIISVLGLIMPSVSFGVGAGYDDIETSSINAFSAGTLDFSLNSASDFSPNITPTQNTLRTIDINNDGSMDFDYSIKSENVSGDLCSSLNLSATLGAYNYIGPISGWNYSAGQFGTVGGSWQFEINLTSSDLSLQNKTCSFDFIVDGLQIGGAGFSDSETISNSVTAGYWSVVLNEILADPVGLDDALMPGGEWVELYNNSSAAFDVSGWVIYDSDDSHELYITNANTNTGSTVVPGNGFLVVYRNGDSDFTINNDNETIRLYNGSPVSSSVLIDSYSWTVEKAEGFSYARIPDGTGAWVDPIPTPGSPNTLECAEQSFDSVTPEIIPQVTSQEEFQEPQQEEVVQPPAEEPAVEELPVEEPVAEEPVVVPSDEINSDSGSAETVVQADNPVQADNIVQPDNTAAADNITAE